MKIYTSKTYASDAARRLNLYFVEWRHAPHQQGQKEELLSP